MLDSVRYSLANLESSPESELDLILGQLCALETQIDRELLGKVENSVSKDREEKSKMTTNDVVLTPNDNSINGETTTDPSYTNRSHRRSGSGGGSSTEMQYTNGARTDSPDNDSAYSDSLSLLSSEQSSSSGGASISNSSQILSKSNTTQGKDVQDRTDQTTVRIKAEKIKIALQKMREASIKKLFIKVFTADNSAKSLLADERMTVSIICRQLAEKNHIIMDPKCSIVEHIPELYLERFYEDNESLVENVLLWTRDSCNRLYFMEKEEKYDLFVNPEKYLLGGSSSERDAQLDDEAKSTLIEEFFTVGAVGVPEVEGNLYLKSDGKKVWKKHFFVLRASGLYYCPKGKSKSSKDLVCLTTFEMNNVYYGFGWRKKYKAPNDFGFAIKHPQIQAKSSKYIKYLCAEDENELKLWSTGIRIAKYGRQLKDNYENIMRDIVEADLDSLANRRSFSVCSMAKTMQVSPTSPTNSSPVRDNNSCDDGLVMRQPLVNTITNSNNNWHRMSRQDSIRSSSTSSSSGCLSERGSNVSTPTMEQLAFEVDFPVGTIKRKPSVMQPKIPLTNTTRNLALQSDDALVEVDSSSSDDEMGIQRNCGTLKSGTLRRSATDERLKTRIYEPLQQRFQNINNNSSKLNDLPPPLRSQSNFDDTIVDELPLPPPPQVLTTSLSTLSLNSLPPPPSEVLDSPDFSSNSTTPKASPVVSPKKSPQSPQVPPKPKLFRRLSESANDRNTYMSEVKRGAHTLHKGQHHRNKLPTDLNSVSCYATSPRIRCGPFINANRSPDCSSPSSDTSPQTPINEMMPSIHQMSANHLQNKNHQQMSSPTKHCCQPLNLYQNIQKRQTQALDQYQAQQYQNNNNNIKSHYNIHQYNSNSEDHKVGHQIQPQPFYPHSQHHQNYSNPSLPMQSHPQQSLPQQYYQQPVQQMPTQYQLQQQQQISHYHHHQRPQQLPLQQMQQYSNKQIYQSNASNLHQQQPNYPINGQTYTKSKVMYTNRPQVNPSSRSPMKGPLPAPPETFLREIQRVMEKKWKVAQTLSTDMSATPNQILGFRDPAYLPPNNSAHNSVLYDVLPSRAVKSVRISSQVNEIPNGKHSRRMPPPPPKRSDATHLTQRQV